MNILFIGDIVGAPGRTAVKKKLPGTVSKYSIDLVVANGENTSSGLGLIKQNAEELFDYGIDVITMGNHTWSKKEIFDFIDHEDRIIRPGNVSTNWPGRASTTFDVGGIKTSVINLIGRVGMQPADCPFEAADRMIDDLKAKSKPDIIILDFHAEATSEKSALAHFLDGRISFFAGTHTHVQTADECILPGGTGYITDAGMTGPYESVIGMDINTSVRRFTGKLPVPYRVADGPFVFSAVFAQIDERSGRTVRIERIREY